MRADRFRRRVAATGDLTAAIAEARESRASLGFFTICGFAILAGFVLLGMAGADGATRRAAALAGAGGLTIVASAIALILGWRDGGEPGRRERWAARLVMLILLIGLTAATIIQLTSAEPTLAVAQWLPFAAAMAAIAALVMPWTSLWAAVATAPPFLAWAALLFLLPNGALDSFQRVIVAVAGLLAGALPIVVGFWREQRREEDDERAALSREVSHMGGELSRARIVHEAMFRPPIQEGPVEVSYCYHPLREIGGDFVHIIRSPNSGRVTVTVIDVSGHGLAAALTVNRLFGELERVVAEARGDVSSALILSQLNRYIHLTMTAHSMFATAACVQLDPGTREVRWAVAGHPPPLLRHKDGHVERLDCTTLVLGACAPDEFDPDEQRRTIGVGDSVIIYTDGAFEARNAAGERFGLKRLEDSVAFDPPPRDFSTFLSNLVERHHEGNPDDDLLVAQLTFKGGVTKVLVGEAMMV